MKAAMENTVAGGISVAALAVSLMVAGGGMSPAKAEPAARSGSNPCDTRDVCSADPARYAAYRDDSIVKSNEYVGEMNWTGGGPPSNVVVPARVLKSADAGSAAPCEVRDACAGRTTTWKVVRVSPAAGDASLASGDQLRTSQNRR